MNLKVYEGAVGDGAQAIGRFLESAGRLSGIATAIAPASVDLGRLARAVTIPVVAQHCDPFDLGARTGFLPPGAVRAVGGRGSLVNHSEHPVSEAVVGDLVERLRSLALTPVVCAPDVDAARKLARFHPEYLAVEPPELIGGNRSVSTARPEVISGSVEAVRSVSPKTRVLCGAGVHDRHDVRRALELGSEGILVASAVARSTDPAKGIAELLAGF